MKQTTEDATKALWAKCPECGHCWAAAYYPMNMAELARISKKHASCPKCDTPGMVAKQDGGVLMEPGQ